MKKIFLTLCVAFASIAMYAAGLEGVKIYVNPGHGSWDPGTCRGMSTIPYQIDANGVLDTCGFFESNTNLWKSLELGKKLEAAGAIVTYSRTANGPYPFPGSAQRAEYQAREDWEKWNRSLVEIREEVEVNGYDYFISIHSNAATEGTTTNYPLLLFRGYDDNKYMAGDSRTRAEVLWPYLFEAMDAGIDPYTYYSKNNPNVRGDISFMGEEIETNNNGNIYYGYYGVLRHGVPGFLSEGYFHTYQPARHRALNEDYCRQEGVRYYRGIAAYYNHPAETKGYIMGTVKDLHEKMSNKLFSYNPKTNDDWKPLNGAVVTLYKGGAKVADYTVDNNWNGVFVFSDLEPGNDYTLDVTCADYKPLFDEYKAPITVKANETTYPMVFLESTTYEPPKIVYVDYPDPEQPGYAVLPSKFVMSQKAGSTYEIEGTIKRTLAVGDSTVVLSHTEDGAAHLYLIDHLTGVLSPISLNGIVAQDKDNLGDFLALSDIAYTCDGKLIGCNYIRCQFDDSHIADYGEGYKRGEIRFYKWDTLSADPTLWVSSKHSGNWYVADGGYTMAVAGSSDDCVITTTFTTASTSTAMRFSLFTIVDNQLTSALFTMNTINTSSPFTVAKLGKKHMLQSSPWNIKDSWVVDGELTTPLEWTVVGQNMDNTIEGSLAEEAYGKLPSVINFFKYAGKIVSVAPYEVEGKIAGVRLYDVTEGLDKAVLIPTTNTDLAEPVAAEYAAATAKVSGLDVTIYLVVDGTVTTFTTKDVEQPTHKGIYAYGLNVTREADVFTFTFTANDAPVAANLVFFDGETEVGRIAIANPVAGANEVKVASMELPGNEGVYLRWGVELEGEKVTRWAKIHAGAKTFGRGFPAVDTYPESDFFGQIYVADRAGSSSPDNGLYIYNPDYTLQNDAPYTGGQVYGSPGRGAVAPNGKYYFADWGDPHSGIWIIDPANPSATAKSFFEGSQDSKGIWSNNGVNMASSTSGIAFYGEGANLRLFAANEDAASPLVSNSINIYNVGQEDGTMVESWGVAPSEIHAISSMANGELALQVTSHGYFVSQTRYAGNNQSTVPSLVFHTFDGTRHYNSGVEHSDTINGSRGSGFIVTPDEKQLIIHDDAQQFVVMDITWNGDVPTLTLNHAFKHGLSDIRQMSLDYAGNIVCSGASLPLTVFAMPHENNVVLTPAKNSLRVIKSSTITSIENAEAEQLKVRKVIENGQVVIIRDGVRYNVMGVRLN